MYLCWHLVPGMVVHTMHGVLYMFPWCAPGRSLCTLECHLWGRVGCVCCSVTNSYSSTMLLNLCAPYAPKGGKKKDKGETISLRPMKREASRGEPSRKVYDSDSIVSSSGAAVPKPVATERGVGKGTPVVESIYASEIPKVKHSQVCIYSSCILHSVIHYTLNLKVVVRRHNVHRHKMLMLGLDGCRISHMQHTTCHVCNRVTRKNWNFSLL